MPNNDMAFHLRRQEKAISDKESQIGSQKRLLSPRDDPMAASHAVRYESYLARLHRFEDNTQYAKDHYNEVDAYLRQANDVLQRVREISIAGANGTFAPEDREYMASEVNELLKEMVTIANAVGSDGKYIFSGDKAFSKPFTLPGDGTDANIVNVSYNGAGQGRQVEITEGAYANLDIPGGDAFWAGKMEVIANLDATSYTALSNQSFSIDGKEIAVATGDTVYSIIDKINSAGAPVSAHLDPATNGLVLLGSSPHMIRAEDTQNSTVLQDLGIITHNATVGAPNWSNTAQVSGRSVFDELIGVRDALTRSDQRYLGSQGIGGMDLALANLQDRMAENGSRQERVETAWARINSEIPIASAALTRESGLDMITAATDLAMLKNAHQAALQVTAQVLPRSLLDYLR
jgi:flagellar hook-associated protein 3 FlgL